VGCGESATLLLTDSAHELDWEGSDPDRFAGNWEPTQFNSLVPDAEKLNIRPSTPKERV
jgi:hypothetical protein